MKRLEMLVTDDNGHLDTGRLLTPIVVLAMLGIDAWAVIVNKQIFDAQQLGIGIASVLAGLAAYLWGDKKPTPGATQ
jgi:hypothetical protein